MTLQVRPATRKDAAGMAELINAIIAIGGTTAYEDPFDAASMDAAYISLPELVSCFVAEADGEIVGFQGLMRSFDPDDPLPDGWATIGTFARVGATRGGIGAALTVGLKRGGMLISLLILPFYMPVLIFGSAAVQAAVTGIPSGPYLAILAAMLCLAIALAPLAIAAGLRISVDA